MAFNGERAHNGFYCSFGIPGHFLASQNPLIFFAVSALLKPAEMPKLTERKGYKFYV